MEDKFFVIISTTNQRALLDLGKYGLDLFRQTAKVLETDRYTIDGLLTQKEIDLLKKEGYSVKVREPETLAARAPMQIVSFQEWLHQIEEE